MAPNTEVQSINVVKGTLGFDFGNEYEVVTHISRNYHPDRPMEIVVQLSDEAFKRMRSFLEGLKLEKTETISEDGKTKYVNTWQKKEHVFSKRHTASHFQQDGHDYTFFSATLTIDLDSKLIAHAETGI